MFLIIGFVILNMRASTYRILLSTPNNVVTTILCAFTKINEEQANPISLEKINTDPLTPMPNLDNVHSYSYMAS